MDPRYSSEAEAYRDKIQAWLAEHLPSGWEGLGALTSEERPALIREWRQQLAGAGLVAVAWPKEYGGGGLSAIEQVVLNEEFAKAGVPTGSPNDGFGIGMVGPTLMVWGTEEQKRHYIPRILSGEDRWCQGYSEPDAGSDLANLGCRAVLDGDEWVLNGQKIWTSSAHSANWVFVLCRTDPSVPKHAGITFVLCPMDQPGVEIRPIVNIIGGHEFNEVFFTDARTARENVIGEVGNGWAVANTLLGFERGGRSTVASITYREELDRLLALARERDVLDDPGIRQGLADAHTSVEIMRYVGMRSLSAVLGGAQPGPESSIMKLLWSEYHKRVTQLALEILGADALLMEGRPAASGIAGDAVGSPSSSRSWNEVAMRARAGTIYAGTSQVQRNILGERVLGLPKEPRADDGPGARSENLLLAALPETERRAVLRSCTTASFRRGDYLFHAGEAGDSLHMVTRGRVAVYAGSAGAVGTAEPVLLTVTGPGEFFGEMALIEGGTRTATVRALEPTGTLRLHRPAFTELRDRHPAVERLLTVALVERVRRLTGQVEELVNVPADARICRRILTLADLYGGEGGAQPIPITQGDLAAMAGAGLRITSRVLGQAREAGLIETGVRRILVCDVDGLRARAGLSR